MSTLVVIGHVTRDLIAGNEHLGGAASYVSLTAAHLGAEVALVTAAPDAFALMQPLRDSPRIAIHRLRSSMATTFELDYTGGERSVRLLAKADTIGATPVASDLVFLAPVVDEVPTSALDWFPGARIVVGLQGWMRVADRDGFMRPCEPPALDVLARAYAIAFSEHDHPDALALADRLAARVPVVVVTRGSAGAVLFDNGDVTAIAAVPAEERDPTGAGDVFAATLTVELSRGATPARAANAAALAAARAVEGPGLGNLPATHRP